jgi:hypothetical protein
LTKEEDLGKKPLHVLGKKSLGATRMIVIALVAIVAAGSVAAAYVALQPPMPSHTPTPTQTPTPTPMPTSSTSPSSGPTPTSAPTLTPTPSPTPSPMPKTRTVDYTTMISPSTDYWNLTVTSPYIVTLNDSMTVSSGDQYLIIEGESYNGNIGVIWQVWFLNATYYHYETDVYGQTPNSGYAYCNNGLVQVSVTNTAIAFIGTTSISFNVPFENLDFVLTRNGDGIFNGGNLSIRVQ